MNRGYRVALLIAGWVLALQAQAVTPDKAADTAQVKAILAAHDRLQPGLEQYMAAVAEDIILLPNGAKAIEGKSAYRRHVEEFYASGKIQINHEVVDLHSFAEVVIVRGKALGTFQAPGQDAVHSFETKNLFVFKRGPDGKLLVWQIIYNDSPPN